MNWSLLRTILILPGTALVYVPALLLWLGRGRGLAAPAGPGEWRLWLALALGAAAVLLMGWTVRLFVGPGEGTPAPWDPPQKFVVLGPYRHVRNPMICGVIAGQLAEALVFGSWLLAAWAVVFFAVNAVYFPLSEEKGLERRFGKDYRRYKANVPRWLPRLRPWSP